MKFGNLLLKWSLKRTVLSLLIPALTFIGGVELWTTYRTALEAANSAYDRSLLGAIKAIYANVSTEFGGVAIELPYTMLEFFELTAAGEVYFKVSTEDRLTEVGSPDLPPPPEPLKTRIPQFYDAEYFGQRVRVGAYARHLDKPISQTENNQRVVIQVAESIRSRSYFVNQLISQAIGRDVVMLLVAGGILAAILNHTLQPLAKLRNEVSSRSPFDLHAIESASVPTDVRPLVEAINIHMARSQSVIEARARFIDDASHQLRTPLATLRTQLDYALRESNPENVRLALTALSRQVDDATRRTNQMLSLARADAAEFALTEVDLTKLCQSVAMDIVVTAREKRIDLAFEAPDEATLVLGDPNMLREAVLNLIHNAIRFTPENGRIVILIEQGQGHVRLSIMDNGPGIPADELPRVGERFFRASNAMQGGSGLGLAIARAVLDQCGGHLCIQNQTSGTGCVATMYLLPVDADRDTFKRLAALAC